MGGCGQCLAGGQVCLALGCTTFLHHIRHHCEITGVLHHRIARVILSNRLLHMTTACLGVRVVVGGSGSNFTPILQGRRPKFTPVIASMVSGGGCGGVAPAFARRTPTPHVGASIWHIRGKRERRKILIGMLTVLNHRCCFVVHSLLV